MYVCEFPVVRSITVKVTVFGDKFSKYILNGGEELDGEDEELLFCELTPWLVEDEEEVELVCCSICCGDEYSTLKALPSNTTVSTEVG